MTKSNKLKCIITGRTLIATKQYYERKVEKAGGEEQLHSTYVCREAKNLLKQGTSIEKIQQILDIDTSSLEPVDEHVLQQIVQDLQTTKVKRINNIISARQTLATKTDPEIKKYINTIINE